ncbi:MAG TPA: PAS domain-containing protein [Chitinophagales bacterium]|nr:PAS domain-containing protein [Chitinophagales bacterium]
MCAKSVNKFQFLSGKGEMTILTRQKDWSATPVGPIETWPQSLRTTIGIILSSKFPMFLWWGPQLTCFYNDAYRPSLGQQGKHPSILGMPAKEAWPEIWDTISPLINQVLESGEATWSADQLIPIYRNGKLEDVYWTFSYSPVNDENGKVAGVLVICNETTEAVVNRRKLEESERRFRNIVKQAPLGITILQGKDFIPLMANDTYLQLVDKREEDFVGRPLFQSLPEVRDVVEPLLNGVLDTGTPFYATELPVILNRYGKREAASFNLVYHPYREDGGTVEGIIVVATEVTESVQAKHKLAESEMQFRSMVMQSPIPMTIFRGPDHVIEMANKVMFEKIWRRSESDVVGRKALDVFPELRNQKYPELLKEVLASGKVHRELESPALVKGDDGDKMFYLDFEYKPLFESDGTVSGIMITVNDVTERVAARNRIKENEDRLAVIIEDSELGTWELDISTQEAILSEQALKILGTDGKPAKRKELLKQLHPEDVEVRAEALKKAMETGHLYYESRFLWKDGSVHWVESKGKMLYDSDGAPVKMIGTVRDVTEQKSFAHELERQVQERTQDLEKMNAELKSFAYVSSHDLQEPLRKIQTFISRILEREEQTLSDAGKDSFKRIQSAAKRMQTLIEDLLTYSRTNTTERKFETADINKLLNQVKADMHEEIQNSNVIIEAGDLLQIETIPFQFKQMLHNLIGNSIKFAREGVTPHVTLSAEIAQASSFKIAQLVRNKTYYHLSVQDNGIGFEMQYRDKIFEVFQRLHGKSEYKGTGIGLAIVKKIVENHSGVITALGEPDKGARFDIYIPV